MCHLKKKAVNDAKYKRHGNMLAGPSSHISVVLNCLTGAQPSGTHSMNAAATIETPRQSAIRGYGATAAQDVLVGDGKYQAVSEGSNDPPGPSTVGDAGAGAGVVMTRAPHWTSLPE